VVLDNVRADKGKKAIELLPFAVAQGAPQVLPHTDGGRPAHGEEGVATTLHGDAQGTSRQALLAVAAVPTLAPLCCDPSTVHSLTPSLHQSHALSLTPSCCSAGFDASREIGVHVVAFLTISACGLIELGLAPFKHDCTRRPRLQPLEGAGRRP